MKKKMLEPINDGIIGFLFGLGGIIPGIAAGTILLITGAYKKVVDAVAHLFSKNFFRNFIILLPFGIGAILAVAALVYPLNLAMEYCMFAIICLFTGLIIGTLPHITDEIKGKPRKKSYIVGFIISFVFTALIGVLSVIFETNQAIEDMFANVPFYLYIVIALVGFVAASGLIVPGFSGSLLLLVLCFYKPILNLFKFQNVGVDICLILVFLIGAVLGFVFFSKIMSHFFREHLTGTYYVSLGLIVGSIVAVFVNSKMFDYCKSPAFGLVDQILGPILLLVGIAAGYMFVRYTRKHSRKIDNAKN